MTICIAMNFGYYALLAADTRRNWGDPPFWHEDGYPKVVETPLGLVTGAGLIDLLDRVKARFTEDVVSNVDDILRIVKEERAVTIETWSYRESLELALRDTGWFFAYGSVVDGVPTTRVAIVHGSFGEDQGAVLPAGDIRFIAPGGMEASRADELMQSLSESARQLQLRDDLSEHMTHHLRLAAMLIRTVADESPNVSAEMTFGYLMVTGERYVSPAVNLNELTDDLGEIRVTLDYGERSSGEGSPSDEWIELALAARSTDLRIG